MSAGASPSRIVSSNRRPASSSAPRTRSWSPAGGSIGSELVRQAAAAGPAEIVLLEMCEFALYSIDREVSENFPGVRAVPLLCDIRDRKSVLAAFRRHKPDLVYHAAALKHVPLVELNPCAGATTNVFGTKNVADAALRCGARAEEVNAAANGAGGAAASTGQHGLRSHAYAGSGTAAIPCRP